MAATPEPPRDARTGVWSRLARVPHLWRRSLRTRVVVSIVALSALVVGTVGLLVMRQLTDGLTHARVNSSVGEAISETASAQRSLASSGGSAFDPGKGFSGLARPIVGDHIAAPLPYRNRKKFSIGNMWFENLPESKGHIFGGGYIAL